MHKQLWYTFLLATGAASTTAEMVGLRLLAPAFGSSLPVWGGAIATVIGGLSLGYHIGGKRAGKTTTPHDVATVAMFATLFFVWMPTIFQMAEQWSKQLFFDGSTLSGLAALCVSVIGLLIPSVTFGMVSPLASQVESARTKRAVGEITGRIFMLTTLGSLMGILIPSFISIPLLGTTQTVWLFSIPVLVMAALLLKTKLRTNIPLIFAIVGGLGASLLIPLIKNPDIVYADETAYQHVVVRQQDNQKFLEFDAGLGIQSQYTPNLYTHQYWDYLATLPALVPEKEPVSVLVLGAGASTSERQMKKFWHEDRTLTFTSVELDEQLFEIANRYFDPPKRKQVAADARLWVQTDDATYDIIIIDTYTRELAIPFHLSTTQFFHAVNSRLNDHGIVAMNINSQQSDSRLIQSLARTVDQIWQNTSLVSVPNSCNRLLLASNTPIELQTDNKQLPSSIRPLLQPLQQKITPKTNGMLLTDNRSPVELLGIAALLSDSPKQSC